MSTTIGLLGNGGQANEIESYLSDGIEVAFRAVSSEYITESSSGLLDIDNSSTYATTPVIVAVGAPGLKREMSKKWPGKNYLTLISNDALVNRDTSLGEGSVVAPGAVITTNVRIGEHVLINVGATVSHDCNIGSYSTISPGVHIAGKVEIGEGVFIGIGATISNNVKIAPGCVIGAGTVVLHDIAVPNSVVVGVPGKLIKNNEDWISEI